MSEAPTMPDRVRLDPDYDGWSEQIIGWDAARTDDQGRPYAPEDWPLYIRADLAAERERKLVEVLGLADDALTEAEAILGGEYGDHYQSLCDTMLTLRTKIASLSEELGYA